MKDTFSFLKNPPFKSFEDQIVSIFEPAPKLPEYFKDGVVQYGPIIALIFGLLGVVSGLISLRFLYIITAVHVILGLLSSLLLLLSFSELKARSLVGWRMVFWSSNLGILSSILRLDVLGVVVGALISYYFLTQVRGKYK